MTRALLLLMMIAAPAVRAGTVVSVTFGGGRANQQLALPLLEARGFRGTFYIITGAVGTPGYLTAGQVRGMATRGHEVGGLTVTHADLTTISVSSATAEVCDGRQDLLDLGITPVVSFDYPFGHSNSTVEGIVRNCGFTSGRRSYGLACNFSGCAVAESLPPDDPFFIRTPPVVTSTTALGEIQRWIVDAENSGGGWIPLAFINICNGCAEWSITEQDFSSLLSWLADRAPLGTVVKTVGEVISGAAPPPPPPPPPPSPPPPSPPPPDSVVRPAVDFERARLFPNPWREDRHSGLGVTIDGLPPSSEIRFFTLSGRWVKTVEAAAGQASWGLTDDGGRGVASGIYRYVITAPGLEGSRGVVTVIR